CTTGKAHLLFRCRGADRDRTGALRLTAPPRGLQVVDGDAPHQPFHRRDGNDLGPLPFGLEAIDLGEHPVAKTLVVPVELLQATTHAVQLVLHRDDHLHAGQVDAVLLGQLLDHAETLDVAPGIATRVARRAGRLQEALALVDPERLRVHAGQLGGDADDVDGAVVEPFGVRPPGLAPSVRHAHLTAFTRRAAFAATPSPGIAAGR